MISQTCLLDSESIPLNLLCIMVNFKADNHDTVASIDTIIAQDKVLFSAKSTDIFLIFHI